MTEYAASEGPGGLYSANHAFADAGPADLGIRFTGTDANLHQWSLEVEIQSPALARRIGGWSELGWG